MSDGKPVELEVLVGDKEIKEKTEENLSPNGKFQYFASKGDVEGMRKCYLQGARVNVPDNGPKKGKDGDSQKLENYPITGDYPLHMAAGGSHIAAMKEIVNWEADVEVHNRIGSTPLHRAVSHGQIEAVERLLSEGASIDATNKIGNTPLHCAAYCGYIEIARLLLEANATAHVKTPNRAGYTPLTFTRISGKAMAHLLLNYQPDSSKQLELKSTTRLSITGTLLLSPENIEEPDPIHLQKKKDSSAESSRETSRETSTVSALDPKIDASGMDFHYLKTSKSDSQSEDEHEHTPPE